MRELGDVGPPPEDAVADLVAAGSAYDLARRQPPALTRPRGRSVGAPRNIDTPPCGETSRVVVDIAQQL
jgi:hypothetical protein